ncbi:MAG: dUTP diphosphatase [Agathobacter sp.]|nr:dUTP diphosphatase [Agathobacter sp.]
MEIKVVLDKGAYMPEKAHAEDAGFDLRTPVDFTLRSVNTGISGLGAECGMITIDTGVHIEIPKGYVGMIKSKSGLNVNHNIVTEGVVDAGYTGSIKVKMYNLGRSLKCFNAGDKITQLVILPIPDVEMVQVEEITGGDRADNGFGSTGK